MPITLNSETEQIVSEAMATTGHATADDLVRDAIRALVSPMPVDAMPDEEFDVLLDEAMAEADRGETVSIEDFKAALRARHNIPLP